jgi:hypothetical protein
MEYRRGVLARLGPWPWLGVEAHRLFPGLITEEPVHRGHCREADRGGRERAAEALPQ